MGIVQPMRFLAGQGLDGMGRKLCRLLPVRIQRVPGQVQAADLFFLLQQFGVGVFFEGWKLENFTNILLNMSLFF